MKHPLITVIVPVFNGKQYITQTIDSVLTQNYHPLQIIVVDDGSTDGTHQVLHPYLNRLTYVTQQNGGPSMARNHGLRLAQGEYIVFLDADDLLLPGKLTEQSALLNAQPEVGYIHSGWHLIDTQGQFLGAIEPWHKAPHLDLKTWLIRSPVYMGAMMFRRAWLEKAGGFDPSLYQAEDVKLMLTLARLGCVGVWQQQATVSYRQHGSSITRNGPQQAESVTRVLAEFFDQPDLPPDIRQIENEVQQNICIWCVWVLYNTGHHAQIATYLRRSLQYSNSPPGRTVQRWLGQILLFFRAEKQGHIEETQAFWPHFKAAIQVSETEWANIERVLNLLVQAEQHKQGKQVSRVL